LIYGIENTGTIFIGLALNGFAQTIMLQQA